MTGDGVDQDVSMVGRSGYDRRASGSDPRAWAVWLLAGAIVTMTTRNPAYLLLLLAISRTVDAVCGQRSASAWSLPFWRVSGVILLFSVLFNMLMAHVGATVLFSFPASWWLIGGRITLEAAVFGLISGLSLIVLLSFFLAFAHAVPPHRLLQLVPRALHELGLVTLIAMTFLPQTMEQQQRVREAQAIRGHRSNGLKSLRPLAIPLLIGGMERSLDLAETMVARGFGSTTSRRQSNGARLLLGLALVLALAGALWLAWGGVQGWFIIAAGLAVLVGDYWLVGRNVQHSRYRPQLWGWADTLIVLGSTLPLLLLVLPLGLVDRSTLVFSPYSGSLWPEFDAAMGLVMLSLAAPAVVELL